MPSSNSHPVLKAPPAPGASAVQGRRLCHGDGGHWSVDLVSPEHPGRASEPAHWPPTPELRALPPGCNTHTHTQGLLSPRGRGGTGGPKDVPETQMPSSNTAPRCTD